MLRRLLLLLIGLVLGGWLLAAASVHLFEALGPAPAPPEAVAEDAPPQKVARAWGVQGGGWFGGRGYGDSIGAEIGDWNYACIMRRGALDRRAATFPLSVRYASNTKGGIRMVYLYVSSEPDFPEIGGLTPTATATPLALREFSVAWFHEIPVPAGTRNFQVLEVAHDGARFSMGHSIPVHETWTRRVYDRYAWWPIFRWLPGGD